MANLIERATGIEGAKEFSWTSRGNSKANILRHAFLGLVFQIMLPAMTEEVLHGEMSPNDFKLKRALLIDTTTILACAVIGFRDKGGIKEFAQTIVARNLGMQLAMDKKQKFC